MAPRARFRIWSRRLVLLTGLLLLAMPGLQPSSNRVLAAASTANRASVPQPNLFDLKDAAHHVHITFSTSGIDGRAHLRYSDPRLNRAFTGKEIRTVPSEIGTLVSVTLEQVPDLHTLTLTLLVPAINLKSAQTGFSTKAILTTQHTSIGGPSLVKGALQTYQVLTLQGTARVVLF
jgi:hypothetical protein